MKRVLVVLFTGALVATVAFSDGGANERYHMKTGRNLPAVEQVQPAAAVDQAALETARNLALERAGFTPGKTVINDADQRFYLKTGRFTPQEESRLEALGVIPGPTPFSSAAPAHNDAAERFHLKTGRNMPASEPEVIAESMEMPCALGCWRALR